MANISSLKTDFPKFLKLLLRGEIVVLCKRNVPVAEIRPLQQTQPTRRRFGQHADWVISAKGIDRPLTQEALGDFELVGKSKL